MKKVYLLAATTLFLQMIIWVVCWPILAVTLAERLVESDFKIYLFSFILGLFSDLVSGRRLGETSVILLILAFTLRFLNMKFRTNPKIVFGVCLMFEIVYYVFMNWIFF